MAALQAYLLVLSIFLVSTDCRVMHQGFNSDHNVQQVGFRHMYPQTQRGSEAYGLGSKIREVEQQLANMNHNFAHNAQGTSVHELLSHLHLQNLKDIYEMDEQFIMNGGLQRLKNLLFQSQDIMNQNTLKSKQKKNEKPYGYPIDTAVQNFPTGDGKSENELKELPGTDANAIDNGNRQRETSDNTEQNRKGESYGNSMHNHKPEESFNTDNVDTQTNNGENNADKSDEADDRSLEDSKSDEDENDDDDTSGEDNSSDADGEDDNKSDDSSDNDSAEDGSNESDEDKKGDQNTNIIFPTMEDRFLGKDLSLDIDCTQLPCMNGGECSQNADGIAECKCPIGHTGRFCEKCVDPCDIHSCSNGGTCVSKNGMPWCLCTDGSHGQSCETIALTSIDNTEFLGGQSELDKVQRNLNQLAFLLSKTETESATDPVFQQSEMTAETSDRLGLDSLKKYEGTNTQFSTQAGDKDGLLTEQQQEEIANWLYQQISKTSTMSSSGQSNNDRVATNLQSTKASEESDEDDSDESDESDESGEDSNATAQNKDENSHDNMKDVYKNLLGNNDIVDLSQYATDDEPEQNDWKSSENDNESDLSSEESSQDDSSESTDTTDKNDDVDDDNSSENDSSSEEQSNDNLQTDDNNSSENPNDESSSNENQSDDSIEEKDSSSGESPGDGKSDVSSEEKETSMLSSSDINPAMIPSLEDLLFGSTQNEKLRPSDTKVDRPVDVDYNPHVGHTLNNALLPDKTSISDTPMNTNSKTTNIYQKTEKESQISQTVRATSDVKTPYGKKKSSATKPEVTPAEQENMLLMPEDNGLNKPYAPSAVDKAVPKITFTAPVVNNFNTQPEVNSFGNTRNLGLSSVTNSNQHQVYGQRITAGYGKQNALQHPASFNSGVMTNVFGDKGNHIAQNNYPHLPQIIQTGVNPSVDSRSLFNQQFSAPGDTIQTIQNRASVGSNVIGSNTIFPKTENLADRNNYNQVDALNGFQHILSGSIDHNALASDKMAPTMYVLQKYASEQPVSQGFGSTSMQYGKLNTGKDNAFSSLGDTYGSTTIRIRPPIILPTEHYNYEDIKHLLREDHLSKLTHHIDFFNRM